MLFLSFSRIILGTPSKVAFWCLKMKYQKKNVLSLPTLAWKLRVRGIKWEKMKKNHFTFTIVKFILKLNGMMHWFQNCLQNKNPSHRTQEMTKNVFFPFPINGEFSEGCVWLRKYGLIYMTIAKRVTLRPPDHMEVIFHWIW